MTAWLIMGCKKEQNGKPGTLSPEECANGLTASVPMTNQYLVLFKTSNNTNMATGNARIMSGRLLRNHAMEESRVMGYISGEREGALLKLSPEEASELQYDQQVELVEADRSFTLSSCFEVIAPRTLYWNVDRVGYGNGIGKTVWIIDTGVDTDHPDLKVDVARSRSFLAQETSIDDENGHGTHVAGIIGGVNNTIGVLGVASGASLVSLKVLNRKGEGTLSSILQALAYVSSEAKAGDVVNMSLGLDTVSSILDWEVTALANKGILFSIAAGNESKSASGSSPARINHANVFTVSAIDSTDQFASFSNYGNDVVDYAAPGVRIISTYTQGRYAYSSGTSMATPHVAGLLLLNGRKLRTQGFALNDPDGVPDPIASR